jgi:hypothetical protein
MKLVLQLLGFCRKERISMIGVNQYQSWFWTLCLRISAALAFAVALLIAVSQSAAGQTFSVLHAFAGGTDGA